MCNADKEKAVALMESDIDFQNYLNTFAKGVGKRWLSNFNTDERTNVVLALHNAFVSGAIAEMSKALNKEQK